jgi:lysyl-tRNA synthetase class I
VASSISGSGALLTGVAREVQTGDLILIEFQDRKARFRIVWVGDSESGQKNQAAVHKVENEECPWVEILQSARS